MEKKLKDMTLEEVRHYCAYTSCKECKFRSELLMSPDTPIVCSLETSPSGWFFKDERELCNEDMDLLKAVKKLFPFVQGIYTVNDTAISRAGTLSNGTEVVFVPCDLLRDIGNHVMVLFEDVEGLE